MSDAEDWTGYDAWKNLLVYEQHPCAMRLRDMFQALADIPGMPVTDDLEGLRRMSDAANWAVQEGEKLQDGSERAAEHLKACRRLQWSAEGIVECIRRQKQIEDGKK